MAAVVCMGPECRKRIKPADRCVTVGVAVNWGDQDLRNAWTGDYVFHSFGCLSDWAAEKAADHDGVVLKEGA